MWINRNKNIIPVRYPRMEIKQDSLKNFFKLCGKYPGVDKTDSEISKVWQSVFDQYATDVFYVMEKRDLIQLKKLMKIIISMELPKERVLEKLFLRTG